MKWDHIAGKWTEFKGKVRGRWAKLTDQDLGRIAGKREQLVVTLQERYGWVREQAERQVKDFESSDLAAATPFSPRGSSPQGSMDDEDEESMKAK